MPNFDICFVVNMHEQDVEVIVKLPMIWDARPLM